MSDTYITMVEHIIREQESVIGPMAWKEASAVESLRITPDHVVTLVGDNLAAVDALVARYQRLFGRASVEVCKDAVAALLPDMREDDIPSSLRM